MRPIPDLLRKRGYSNWRFSLRHNVIEARQNLVNLGVRAQMVLDCVKLALSIHSFKHLVCWSPIIALMAFALFLTPASGIAAPINVDPSQDVLELSGATEIVEDLSGELTLADVSRPAFTQEFKAGTIKNSYSPSAFWVRFSLRNVSTATAIRWLDTGDRRWLELDFYAPDASGVFQHLAAGAMRPFADRPLPTANFVFPVVLRPNGTTEVYMRVRSNGQTGRTLALRLWQPGAYQAFAMSEKAQWFIYIGMALALCLLNLLLLVSTRDVNYLLYVVSLLSVVWGISSARGGIGAAYEYVWPASPGFEQFSWVAAILVSTLATSLFFVRFVDLRRTMPQLNGFVKISWVVLCLLYGTRLAVSALAWPVPLWFLQKLVVAAALSNAVFVVVLFSGVVRLAWSGDRSAKYITLAWSPLLVLSIGSNISSTLGYLPIQTAFLWASAFELVMMSWALADRFNRERRARALAQEETVQAQSALVEGLQRSERELEIKVDQRTQALQLEQARTKELLHNILPAAIAEELAQTGTTQPVRHESATVLFTDFSGFTQAASTMPPGRMVAELNEVFAAFDRITDACGVEKIKTIGDAYMAVAGVPTPCADHARRAVQAGLHMVQYVNERNQNAAFKWGLRVGIHTGPVVAGVVGTRKFAFDIWGDTVNIASRMESGGEPGRVNVSAYTYDLIRADFACDYRGKIGAKGKGEVDMYFVRETPWVHKPL